MLVHLTEMASALCALVRFAFTTETAKALCALVNVALVSGNAYSLTETATALCALVSISVAMLVYNCDGCSTMRFGKRLIGKQCLFTI
jgi:hypothetical protein